jgi:dATP pyrophosphohydrolase
VSPFRPDLIDLWMFRVPAPGSAIEFLLLRRAKDDDILPGLWQGVSGGLDADETAGEAALRELREEAGFGPDEIEAFYHLDQVNQFLEPSLGGVLTAAVFAVRLRPGREPVLSREHDDYVWVSPARALELAVWPAYRESIRRVVENLMDPARSIWFELAPDGERAHK